MPKTVFEGQLTATDKRFGIAVSRFNDLVTSKLLDGALDCLRRHGASDDAIEVAWVPGSFELPLVAKKMAATRKYNAIISLGAVIRGGTPHFEYIASEVTKGVAKVSLEAGVPVIYGIITADSLEEAIERAGTKMGNTGFKAAETALEMANLLQALG